MDAGGCFWGVYQPLRSTQQQIGGAGGGGVGDREAGDGEVGVGGVRDGGARFGAVGARHTASTRYGPEADEFLGVPPHRHIVHRTQ